jgi:hypothetical protein
MHYDLRYARFEEFLDFIFDRPVAAHFSEENRNRDVPRQNCWYDDIELEVEYDPARNCEYFALLFCDPAILFGRYTRSQLEQGFRWMQLSYNDGSAADILWAGALPLERRLAMLQGMYFLYADLFAVEPLFGAPYMWWENLTGSVARYALWTHHAADRFVVEQAMFRVLSRILQLESEHCRIDALHGLNHLVHPNKETLIRGYLARYPGLDEDHRRYAEGAISGALL